MNPGRGANRPGPKAQEARMNRSIVRPALFALAAFAAMAASFALAGSGKGNYGSSGASMDIVDTAVAAGNFKTLVAAVQAAGLVDTLKGEGPFTVFAPTDEAFAKLPPGTVEGLLKDKAKLTEILTFHVVAGKVTSSDVAKLASATTVSGKTAAIDITDGVRIDGARVVKTDIAASNGVIHVIDTVMIP
jgi:uncharacterized surface protein with fasciclin (FAS1) repeats